MEFGRKELLAYLIVVLLFVSIQFRGLFHIAPGDENVYYYMAKSVSEGELPYKDFFYAHPPLHVIMLAIVVKLFGVNFFALKSATLLALLIASFFLYLTCIELFKKRLSDKNYLLISILALILFLFSFEVMFKATFSMGINFSLMLLMAGFYFIFTRKYFIGGLIAGLAGLTRLYTLAPLTAVFIFLLSRKYQENKLNDFLKMLLGFFITFGIPMIFMMLVFGSSFIEPVIKYHFLKPQLPGQRMIVYKNVLIENWPTILAFLSSVFLKEKKKLQLFYLTILTCILFLLSLNVPYEFYFSLALPFMAVVGSYSVIEIIRRIKTFVKYILIIGLCSLFVWNTAADAMFLEKIGFLEFAPLKDLNDKISSSDEKFSIFGDDSVVPLLALITNRKIAFNYIDSNEKRLTSGLTNFYLLTNQLDDANLSYIVLRKGKGMHQILEFRQYVEERCKPDNQFFDIAEGSFLIYKCFT